MMEILILIAIIMVIVLDPTATQYGACSKW